MLVLDANILIRAVLGSRVLFLLHKYAERVDFMAPDTAFQEARERLPEILERRKVTVAPAMTLLDLVARIVQTVEPETYSQYEAIEGTDFFGCGVATLTTNRVELYLTE